METKKYDGLSFEELRTQLLSEGYDLRGCADGETQCLLCLKAGIVMVGGELIGLDEVVSAAYHDDEWWNDGDAYKSEKADIYGVYEERRECDVIYDSDGHGERTTCTVVYLRDGEKRQVKVEHDGSMRYWILGLLQYVKKRCNEYKKEQGNEQD